MNSIETSMLKSHVNASLDCHSHGSFDCICIRIFVSKFTNKKKPSMSDASGCLGIHSQTNVKLLFNTKGKCRYVCTLNKSLLSLLRKRDN